MNASLINGMFLSLGLIVCLGAQNVFLLKQAARGEYSLSAASMCLICDMILIALGVFGMGYLMDMLPMLRPFLKWGAVLFLLYCAAMAIRNGFSVGSMQDQEQPQEQPSSSFRSVIFKSMAFSFLNPAALADTLLVIGGASDALAPGDKSYFALGAMLGSGLWFYSLVMVVGRFRKLTRSNRFWKGLEFSSAAMFILISIQVIAN